jgi:hypothetical protein
MAKGHQLEPSEVRGWAGTIIRETAHGLRRQPKWYAAAWATASAALTVFLVVNHAPAAAFVVPTALLACTMLAGTRSR